MTRYRSRLSLRGPGAFVLGMLALSSQSKNHNPGHGLTQKKNRILLLASEPHCPIVKDSLRAIMLSLSGSSPCTLCRHLCCSSGAGRGVSAALVCKHAAAAHGRLLACPCFLSAPALGPQTSDRPHAHAHVYPILQQASLAQQSTENRILHL